LNQASESARYQVLDGKFHCPESFPSGKLADEKIVAED